MHIYQYLGTSRMWQKVNFFMQSLTALSFASPRLVAIPRIKSTVCPIILPIAGGRTLEFIPFPMVLALYKTETTLSRIWTQVAMSISNYDIYYTYV